MSFFSANFDGRRQQPMGSACRIDQIFKSLTLRLSDYLTQERFPSMPAHWPPFSKKDLKSCRLYAVPFPPSSGVRGSFFASARRTSRVCSQIHSSVTGFGTALPSVRACNNVFGVSACVCVCVPRPVQDQAKRKRRSFHPPEPSVALPVQDSV